MGYIYTQKYASMYIKRNMSWKLIFRYTWKNILFLFFDFSANDVALTALYRTIEIDLRDMLNEKDLPKPA